MRPGGYIVVGIVSAARGYVDGRDSRNEDSSTEKEKKEKNAQVKTDTFLYEPHTVSVHITSPLHPTATESICLKRLSHALM